MMLDKFTFGKTPAAVYLADRLNLINDPRFTRRISSHINVTQTVIAELVSAHEAGNVSIKLLQFVSNSIRIKIKMIAQRMESQGFQDEFSINLMSNVLIGNLKSIDRRATGVVIMKRNQDKTIRDLGKNGIKLIDVSKKLTIADVKETITAETLMKKSRLKMKKLDHSLFPIE